MVTEEVSEIEAKRQCGYELVFIISPEVGDEAIDPTIENVSQFIKGKGGIISEVEQWGKKKLAYPIKHSMEGSYVLIQFKLNPLSNKELEAHLQLSEKILRYLLVKIE